MLGEILFVLAKSSYMSAYSLLSGCCNYGSLLSIGWVMNWPIIPLILQKYLALFLHLNID
jgi:hypothetical protein